MNLVNVRIPCFLSWPFEIVRYVYQTLVLDKITGFSFTPASPYSSWYTWQLLRLLSVGVLLVGQIRVLSSTVQSRTGKSMSRQCAQWIFLLVPIFDHSRYRYLLVLIKKCSASVQKINGTTAALVPSPRLLLEVRTAMQQAWLLRNYITKPVLIEFQYFEWKSLMEIAFSHQKNLYQLCFLHLLRNQLAGKCIYRWLAKPYLLHGCSNRK